MRDRNLKFQISILGWMLALASIAPAQFDSDFSGAESMRREHYVVLTAENSPLQKFLVGKRNGQHDYVAHLLVDGQALLTEQGLSVEAIDWAQLKQDLHAILAQVSTHARVFVHN